MANRTDKVSVVLQKRMFAALAEGQTVSVLISGKQDEFEITDARSADGLLTLIISPERHWHVREALLIGVRVMKPHDYKDIRNGGVEILV